MTMCFLNNVYLCYLPAHCSHGLQPNDNGVFNVIKSEYRKQLSLLNAITDSAPVDKVNFIRCYVEARKAATEQVIKSAWRITGNWPVSRFKALHHPEIQIDEPKNKVTPEPESEIEDDSPTPKTSRQIRDIAKNEAPEFRRKIGKIANAFERKEEEIVLKDQTIAGLKARLEQLERGKKRKKIPNPNKRFMAIAEVLAGGQPVSDEPAEVQPNPRASASSAEESASEGEESDEDMDDDEEEVLEPEPRTSRSGREIRRPSRFIN